MLARFLFVNVMWYNIRDSLLKNAHVDLSLILVVLVWNSLSIIDFFHPYLIEPPKNSEQGLASPAKLQMPHHGIPARGGLEGPQKLFCPMDKDVFHCPSMALDASRGSSHIPNRILRVWGVEG